MKEKIYCRGCHGMRKCKLIYEYKTGGHDDEYDFYWTDKYSIIQCLGCESVSFLNIYGDSEMIDSNKLTGEPEHYDIKTIYPLYLEGNNVIIDKYDLPKTIRTIYFETIEAFKVGAFILTAGGFRAIIEAVCNHLKIKEGNLVDRIDSLNNSGHLSTKETNRLHSIRFLGNDALHQISKPDKNQLLVLLKIVNHLLENLFISDKALESSLETMIDSYSRFKTLVIYSVNDSNVSKTLTVTELLDKSIRRVPKALFKEFEKKILDEVRSGQINLFELVRLPGKPKIKLLKVPRKITW